MTMSTKPREHEYDARLKSEFPEVFMSEEEIKNEYDGKICAVCGEPFNYRIISKRDGSRKIYPHGVWAARKHLLMRILGIG